MDILWLEQTEVDLPIENHWLSTREMICVSGMRFAKRRNDWRLGRWTAKHAIAACLNLPTDIRALADIEVLAMPSGAPAVFLQGRTADIAISLSHRNGRALCTVAPAGTTFGCDLEAIEPRSNAFVADYCTSDEQALIARSPVERRNLLVCLIWSAKESALKAMHMGLRLDTRCVCVRPTDWLLNADTKELCTEHPASNPDAWHALGVHPRSGPLHCGWWRLENHLVRTIVRDRPLPIPERIRQSGLAEAPFLH